MSKNSEIKSESVSEDVKIPVTIEELAEALYSFPQPCNLHEFFEKLLTLGEPLSILEAGAFVAFADPKSVGLLDVEFILKAAQAKKKKIGGKKKKKGTGKTK